MSTPIEIGQLTRLELGYVGESGSRDIQVDMTAWLDKWPEGAIAVNVRRPEPDETYYLAATEVEGSLLTWMVTATDVVVAGRGMAQISIYDQVSGAVYKSRTVQTIIRASIDETLDEDAPDPMDSWVAHAALEADRATSARQMAAEARDEAEDAAEDAKGYAAESEDYASRAKAAAIESEGGATSASASATMAKGYALRAETAQASAETSKAAAAASAEDAASSKAAAEAHKTAAMSGAQRAETAAAEVQGAVDGFAGTVAAAEAEISASKQAAVDEVEAKGDEVLGSIPEDYRALVAEAKTHAPGIVSEESGEVATCTDAAARDALAVVSHITAVQEGEGDPSSTNIRPITGRFAVGLWHGAEYDANSAGKMSAALPEEVYGGTLDWVSGVLTVTHKLVTLTSASGYWGTGSNNFWFAVNDRSEDSTLLSNRFVTTTRPGTQMYEGQMRLSTTYPRVGFANPGNALTIDQWKAQIDASPIQLVYELAEPYTIQLTPQQVTMLKGSNALWSDTGSTSVTYIADTKMYIDNALAAIAAAIINQ